MAESPRIVDSKLLCLFEEVEGSKTVHHLIRGFWAVFLRDTLCGRPSKPQRPDAVLLTAASGKRRLLFMQGTCVAAIDHGSRHHASVSVNV
jgi:hypothetical protein